MCRYGNQGSREFILDLVCNFQLLGTRPIFQFGAHSLIPSVTSHSFQLGLNQA